MYSKEPEAAHSLHSSAVDGDGGVYFSAPPEVHYQLLCLCNVEGEMVVLTPVGQGADLLPSTFLVMLSVLLSHLAEKHNLHRKDLKDRVIFSLGSTCTLSLPFCADPKPKLENIQSRANERYLPKNMIVAKMAIMHFFGQISQMLLAEWTLELEERFPGIYKDFPNIKSFQGRMIQIPAINRFLQPGSKRKPPPDTKLCKGYHGSLPVQITISVKSVPYHAACL
uniref:Uncharacterized protein n=1 Tax=Astatotilapia calliptera TaxID=8154 RepID=A0AAX7UWV5_ASTCA